MSIYGTPPEMPNSPGPGASTPGSPPSSTCSACGSESLEQGFIEDNGEGSQGFARWIAGPLERGLFGGARRMGKPKFEVHALRCANCQHLDLYVGNQT